MSAPASTDLNQLPQGDPRLLQTETAQTLLRSRVPARVAFVWFDGTPRVVPTWFHWNGEAIVMTTYEAGPNAGVQHASKRVKALRANPRVAITIDTEGFPPDCLTIHGDAEVSEVDGLAEEYVLAAKRYLGEEGAAGLVSAMDQPGTRQYRIVVRPAWVGLLDFKTRLPSALGGVLPAQS